MTKHLTIFCVIVLVAGFGAVGCRPGQPEMAQPPEPPDVSAPPSKDGGGASNTYSVSQPRLQGEQKACPKCGGQGTTDCIRCNGAGTETCGFCWGSGSVDVTCRTCNGTGKVQGQTCSTCNGSRTVTEQCDNCSGVGHLVCGRCNGQGVETCSICRGTGINPVQ